MKDYVASIQFLDYYSLLLSYSSSQVVASLYLMANNHHYNTNVMHVGQLENWKENKDSVYTTFHNQFILEKARLNIQTCFK